MPSLADILAPLESTTAKLRGRPIVLRPVLGSESAAIERQFPEPVAKDEAEQLTELFQLRTTRYQCVRRAIFVAVSAELANSAGEKWNKDRPRAWVEAFADEIWSQMLEREILELWLEAVNIGKEKKSEAEQIGTDKVQGN